MHTDPYAGYALAAVLVRLPNGARLAECVDADGTTAYWLLDPQGRDGNGCADTCCAPHDQEGPYRRPRTRNSRT